MTYQKTSSLLLKATDKEKEHMDKNQLILGDRRTEVHQANLDFRGNQGHNVKM